MNELRKISKEELNKILDLHKKWLNNEKGGKKADLSYTDLRGVDLSYANLKYAILEYADLKEANLKYAILEYADLSYANLKYAILEYADLKEANLKYAILEYADLKEANLKYAILTYANLNRANLKNVDLTYAKLNRVNLTDAAFSSDFSIKESGVKFDHMTSFLSLQCPEEGSFIGFKKSGDKIVKLLIMEDSLRSSATTRKCRASHVKVLDITNIEGTEHYTECENTGRYKQKYIVGEEITIKDFDKNRWEECSTGIHFFITRQEAIMYN